MRRSLRVLPLELVAPAAQLVSAVLVALVALVVPITGGQAAAAQTDPDIARAVSALGREAALLVELDAFDGPISPRLRAVHDAANLDPGIGRGALVVAAGAADDTANIELDNLRASGLQPSDALTSALGVLSEADRNALARARRVSVPPAAYDRAFEDLGATVPSGSSPPAPTAAQGQAPSGRPSATLPVQSTPKRAGEARGVSVLWLVAGGVALTVLAAVVVGAVLRRRDRDPAGGPDLPDAAVAQLLDAARRLGGSLDTGQVRSLAVREAAALTGATGAAFLSLSGDGPVLESETPFGTVDPDRVGRSIVARVLSTGMASRAVVDEAVFGEAPVAVLVVPVVRSGHVVGVICATRDPDLPFEHVHQELLCRLSPFVSAALDAAAVHGGVTELSLTDGLTSLANRRRLDRDLPAALAARHTSVGFLMIDIDHFKTYNDANGHPEGDAALRQVASIISGSVRPDDIVYRYGGEEFCVLLADASPAEATAVAERVRVAVEAATFTGQASQPAGRVTVSVGVALSGPGDGHELTRRADAALYAAKRDGRNRVVAIGP